MTNVVSRNPCDFSMQPLGSNKNVLVISDFFQNVIANTPILGFSSKINVLRYITKPLLRVHFWKNKGVRESFEVAVDNSSYCYFYR